MIQSTAPPRKNSPRGTPPASRLTCRSNRDGISLIEVLVAFVLIAVLSATVYPLVIQQLEKASALRVANDLRQIAQGVRTFQANLGVFPSDLEDLFNPVGTADRRLSSPLSQYTAKQQLQWFGPYMDRPMIVEGVGTGNGIRTGFGAQIQKRFTCYNTATGSEVSCIRNPNVFVAIRTLNITGYEFEKVNDILDVEESHDLDAFGRSESRRQGRLRLWQDVVLWNPAENATMYYLIMPYR